jgi:hypothetical protein
MTSICGFLVTVILFLVLLNSIGLGGIIAYIIATLCIIAGGGFGVAGFFVEPKSTKMGIFGTILFVIGVIVSISIFKR